MGSADGGQPNIKARMIKGIRKIYISKRNSLHISPYCLIKNSYNPRALLKKNLYDPSIGQESLTTVDVVGVLVGHILFGIGASLFCDWSWIPLSPQEKASGRSLKDIKRSWGWNETPDQQEDYQGNKTKKLEAEDNN